MRYILFLILFFAICDLRSQTVTQPGIRDYQISGAALPDSILYIMGTDTTDGSSKQGLAKWYRYDSLIVAGSSDHDFYGYNTSTAPLIGEDSIKTATSINYVLFDSAKIHSYTPNFNNWFPWYQTSITNSGTSGYLGHRSINFDGLAAPALTEPYGSFGEWIETTSWDNSINAGFEDGGNMIHNFGFNYDLGAANYNALRPGFKWSVEQGYYPGSGNSMWVESHWEHTDTLGRTFRPISTAAAYDGSYSAFSATSDLTTIFQSPDQIVGDGKWQEWNYSNGTDDMWYNYHGRINKQYTGTVLEKYSNTIVAPTYRNILTHDADDDLWVGDSTGIDITNKLRFRINGYSTPLIKSNNYTLQFDTMVVNFLGDNSNVRHFTLQKPGDSDKMLFGYDGATMNIGKFNDDEAIIRVHQDAPNYSFGIRSTGKIDFNINGAYGGIDFKQFSDDLAGGWMTRDAAQAYYVGNYIDGSDHWVWNFNGSEYYRFKSNGQINATQYDATPLTGTPFRLLAHENDGDFISASWIQVIDSTLNNGLMDTILTYGGGTDTDDQNLTIEGAGPTYDIAINDGTDVTVSNVYGLTLSEPVANTLGLAVDTSKLATQYDISGFGTMSNWLLAASGTGGTETVTNGETVTFAETTGLDATRSTNTVSYALSIDEYSTDAAPEGDELGLFYDVSGTNHELVDISELLNVVEEGNVTVQSDNMNLDFQSMFDVAADGTGEVNISFDGGEATTVTTAESDDYLLMHDSGLSQNQKMLWSDFVIDIIGFEEDNINEGNGNTFDFGTGLDLSVTGAEADISLDFNEFATDAATEGDEYVILYDPSAADEEKVLITSLSGGTDTNFAEDDLTFTGSRTHDMGVNSLTLTGTATNVYIQEENGGTGNMLVLVSELGAGTGITGGISFQSENGGTPTEQYDVESYKWSTNQSTFKISGEQATDAEITYEKNADLADNTTESHISINGGFAITQNYDGSTGGADLSIDRSYYYVNITGGNLTDTIKLPEVASTTDNWSSSLSSTQCQVGQEYVISNLRSAVNLVIGAYNPAGTSDDLIGTRTAPGGSAGSAISIAPGKSVIVKCYQLAGGIGYWNYWLSN